MSYNFNFSNDKPDIRETIPAGVPLFLQLNYAPGGYDVSPDGRSAVPGGSGALTKSKPNERNPNPDTAYVKAEFTVLRGPFKGRKFWGNLTVVGGELNEKGESKAGKITRGNIRSIIDSSQGLASNDETPEASAKRVLPQGFASLQGLRFLALSKVEPAQNGYPAKNGLGQVLTKDMKSFPKSDAEIDNPVLPQGAAQAASAPIALPGWASGAPTPQATAAPSSPTTVAAATFGGAPAQQPPPAAVANSGIPAWAQ